MTAELAVLLAAQPALATPEVRTLTSACERGVAVPARYMNAADALVLVLTVEGRQITQFRTQSASGARHAWPSDGSGHVCWSKEQTVTLFWIDGATKAERPLLSDCVAS